MYFPYGCEQMYLILSADFLFKKMTSFKLENTEEKRTENLFSFFSCLYTFFHFDAIGSYKVCIKWQITEVTH